MRSTKQIFSLCILILAVSYPIALVLQFLGLDPKDFGEPNLTILVWPFIALSQAFWFVRLNLSQAFFRTSSCLLVATAMVSILLAFPSACLLVLGLCVAVDLGVDPTKQRETLEPWCALQSLGGIVGTIVAFA